jgi:predicted GH43/DUF377 family glycosyl hydrolase
MNPRLSRPRLLLLTAASLLTGSFGFGATETQSSPPAKSVHDFIRPRMFFADPASTPNQRTKDPSVVRFRDRYWMYYSVWTDPTHTAIGIATSDNLLDWQPQGFLPLVGKPEADGVAAPGALVLNGRIHLFYQSYSPRDFGGASILHAWSDDGVTFTRNPTNPIVRPRHPDGKPFVWSNGRAIDGEAYVIGDSLFLYYASRDPSGRRQIIGASRALLASELKRDDWKTVSPDAPLLSPKTPTPLDPPDLDLAWEGDCIEAASMVHRNGLHYMFYAGNYNNAPQQIGVAVSTDGIHFRRLNNGRPILERGQPGTWNHSESGHPGAFVDNDGRTYLFYQGCNQRLKPPLDWHLSMVPITWHAIPGQPDLPLPDFAALPR